MLPEARSARLGWRRSRGGTYPSGDGSGRTGRGLLTEAETTGEAADGLGHATGHTTYSVRHATDDAADRVRLGRAEGPAGCGVELELEPDGLVVFGVSASITALYAVLAA
jgi:hypothetical protein